MVYLLDKSWFHGNFSLVEKDFPMSATVYRIPAENMPGLMFKLAKLAKKSQRLLGKPIELQVGRTIEEPVMVHGKPVLDAEGAPYVDIFHEVTIEAEPPTIAGWTFIATLDHSAKAGNIIRIVPNTVTSISEKYRTVGPLCDHCGKIRTRRDTYLLRCDATGEVKQIGRTCVKDFIPGVNDPEGLVEMAQLLGSAAPSGGDSDMDWSGGMKDRCYILVTTYLAHVSALIHADGWVPQSQAGITGPATSGAAHFNMFPPPNYDRRKLVPLTKRDMQTAAEAVAWAAALTGRNEYFYNLSIVAKETMVEHRSCGLLASMIPAFLRAKEREFGRAQEARAMRLEDSRYVGTIGERLRGVEATLYGFKAWTSQYSGLPTYFYTFQTADGNVLVWGASDGAAKRLGFGTLEAVNHTKVTITGTVKAHTEYRGVKQTRVNRCIVVSENGAVEDA